MENLRKYTATFTALAKVTVPSDQDRHVAKASLEPLKSILPPEVNVESNPDLLYIAWNGAVAGLVNRNGDAVDAATALLINDGARNKYISTDHNREQVVGVILYPGLSTFATSEVITPEQAAALNEPFNMAYAGVLWRVINPMLSKYIINTDGGLDDALSMSWEIAFDSYDIAVGSLNLFEATMIRAGDPQFSTYDAMLRCNGGTGKDNAGQPVSRVINGNPLILGYSIVPNPAAHVKGIQPIENTPVIQTVEVTPDVLAEIPESQRAYLQSLDSAAIGSQICDITMEDGTILLGVPVIGCRFVASQIAVAQITAVTISQKSEEKNITSTNIGVNTNSKITMKIANFQELVAKLPEIGKLQSVAEIVDILTSLEKDSGVWLKDIADKESAAKTAEADRAKMADALAAVQQELVEIRQKAAAAESAQKFTERMTAFDEEFELEDDDRKILASDIKDLDDESYAAYMAKCKVLMKDKSKAAKKAKKIKDDEEAEAAKSKKSKSDDDMDDAAKKSKAALASIIEDDKGAIIPNGDVEVKDVPLAEQFAKAFAVKNNGKEIK